MVEVQKAKQYCRYCVLAIDHDDILVCVASAPCGNNGSGKCYNIEKAKRVNNCKYFEFNSNDLLRVNEDGSFKQYKPREATKPNLLKGQIKINFM